MTARVVATPDGRYTIELGTASNLIRVLEMSPRYLEAELRRGVWLVVAVAVWSGSDLQLTGELEGLAARLTGIASVAVRPFDSHAELEQWCPSAKEAHRSPVWLLLKDGVLQAERAGIGSLAEMEEEARRVAA